MTRCVKFPLVLAVFCLLARSSPIGATTILPVSERDLFRESKLIFTGTVTGIDTRVSDRRTAADLVLPYTFVTFKIDRIFKGKVQTPGEITLRFEGGPLPDGTYFEAVGMPKFEEKAQYVLFVRNNPARLCPITGWHQGIFRVVGKDVFSADGRRVWNMPDGTLAYVPVESDEEALRRSPGNLQLVRSEPGRMDVAVEGGRPAPTVERRTAEGKQMDYRAFSQYVQKHVASFNTSAELKQVQPVQTADFRARFYIPRSRAVPLPDRR